MITGGALRILHLFTHTDTLGFADICKQAGYGTDLGGYYLRQLQRGDYINKSDRGRYTLTATGKQQLTVKRSGVLRPRLAILLVAKRGTKYAALERTTQPFIGKTEWPAATVGMGEEMSAAAERILEKRLGLVGKATYVGFFRRIDMLGDDIFDDKLFAVHTFDIAPGSTIREDCDTGKIVLLDETALQNVERPAKSLLDILKYVKGSMNDFEEHVYHLGETDLAMS